MGGDDPTLSGPEGRHLYGGLEEVPGGGEGGLLLRGPAGNIEISVSHPGDSGSVTAAVVVFHPHPLYGGSMANKVVFTLSEIFKRMGVVTLRFNFRGVGLSDGEFDQGRGEATDLHAVARWLRERFPGASLWVAGFSFGAYVALRAQPVVRAERLLLVAPPVSLFDFRNLAPVAVPWMVIQGGNDEVVDSQLVLEWIRFQPRRPLVRFMADADHFFHGRLRRLGSAVESGWRRLPVGP